MMHVNAKTASTTRASNKKLMVTDNAASNISASKSIKVSTKTVSATVRPWYSRGGMHVNMVGMAINIFGPVIVLLLGREDFEIKFFCAVWLSSILLSVLQRMKTLYCVVIVPTFFTSLLLLWSFSHPTKLAILSVAFAIAKVNFCMSTCLHRYAAHGAFKCGPITSMCMLLLGSLANQGGPLWWASQHRCHHKFCDIPRDPHSPIVDGVEAAFGFFELHQEIEEEFTPPKIDSKINRILDTWAWTVHCLELIVAYFMFQREGLFVAFTSGWICQTMTLWFNIANHPPNDEVATPSKKECKASNSKARPSGYYLPFHFLDLLYPLFCVFVAEGEHEHHHEHARLAKRSKYDYAYWLFLVPLEKLGLVWSVNV